ncbi:GAF and ANTAR domain-containing protein [Salinibacterium sp.]|uniref:GAF and ANTAR domain-containing protein n=1 Tax=Salinibacterium sp. TaxID=1915057 RepID=UPI00286C6E43|nr:GAF and ANTAR domain-containing protein [Salinibacterium sp.]
MCASDDTAARIDELQFALGEGPRWEVVRTGRATIIPNLLEDSNARWPIFGEAVSRLGVGALFVFPLILGAAVVGVADMYRHTAGNFTSAQTETARTLAAVAAAQAVMRATVAAGREWAMPTAIAPEMRREVQQATGMILVQLNTTATEALIRLKSHAFTANQTLEEVARNVVTRQLDFRDIPE